MVEDPQVASARMVQNKTFPSYFLLGGALSLFLFYLAIWPMVWHLVLLPHARPDKHQLRVESQAPHRVDNTFLFLDKPDTSLTAYTVWQVPKEGFYHIKLSCDDNGKVSIDNRPIITLIGISALNVGGAKQWLSAGPHFLELRLNNILDQGWLRIEVAEPGQAGYSSLSTDELSYLELGNIETWLGVVFWGKIFCLLGFLGLVLPWVRFYFHRQPKMLSPKQDAAKTRAPEKPLPSYFLLMKKKERVFLLVIIGVSILTRGLTLIAPYLSSDETSVGLMSLMVMKGDFPVFYYGQNFMGSLEAFLGGSFFQFFGPSPFTLELLPVIFSILFLFLLYLLSKLFFDYKTALISIALLSIPPLSLLEWSHEARLHYHFAIIFGNFLLLISHNLIYRDIAPKTKRTLFIFLGLLSGIGWWTNYLIITYILPVGLFLFLRDKKVLFSKNFLLLLFMFLLGSSPLWAYNAIHYFSIIGITSLWDLSHIIPYLKDFCTNAFPIVLGFLPPLNHDRFDLVVYLIIGPIYLIALVYYVSRFREGLNSAFSFRLTKTTGGEIFLFLFLVNILLNLLTIYGTRLSDNGQQYLLPLYTCLPIFVAVLLVDIEKKFYFSSILLLGLILLSNFVGNLRHDAWTIFSPGKFQTYQKYEETENRLIDFLIHNGYTRLYYEWPGNRLIFKSKGALIVSHPYKEGWLQFIDLVDASPRLGYLFKGEHKGFEENMKAIGGSFRKVWAPGGYVVYTEFKPLYKTYRMIPRDLWTGTSNVNPSQVKNAFDGNIMTGWKTLGHQKKGDYFLLDLGRVETVGKISYIPAVYNQVPSAYQVAVSSDGKNWQIVSEIQGVKNPTFWTGPNPMTKVRHGRIETVFSPHQCRFLKISLLQDSDDSNWSINELFLFSPDDERGNTKSTFPESQEIDQLLTFLKAQKINFVYANNWLSPVIRVKSNGKIQSVISNYLTGKNGEEEPDAEQFARAHLDRTVAVIVEKEDRDLEKLLVESDRLYRKKELGPFIAYYDFSSPKCQIPLPIKNWKVTSNANPQEVEKAIDRDLATRWSSGKPQEPGIYFQIDLNTVQLVKGCTLSLGKSLNDYPRSLRFLYSLDGSSWQEIKATAKLELYWTGETLLKMTGEKTLYFFSPVYLRYLRMLQEGQDPVYYWSIHELELF